MRGFLIHIGCIFKIFKAIGSLDAAISGKPRRIWPVYLNNITGRAFCLHPDIHVYLHDQGMRITYEPPKSCYTIKIWQVCITRTIKYWNLVGGYSNGEPWEAPHDPTLRKIDPAGTIRPMDMDWFFAGKAYTCNTCGRYVESMCNSKCPHEAWNIRPADT